MVQSVGYWLAVDPVGEMQVGLTDAFVLVGTLVVADVAAAAKPAVMRAGVDGSTAVCQRSARYDGALQGDCGGLDSSMP